MTDFFKNPLRLFFTAVALIGITVLGATTYLKSYAFEYNTNMNYVLYHVHEIVFGFFTAGVIGFLLTAFPNWTGQKPIQAWWVFGLGIIWASVRILWIIQGEEIQSALLVLDLAPFFILISVMVINILKAKYWRGFIILTPVLTLSILQITANYNIYNDDVDGAYSIIHFSLFLLMTLVAIIGGRVTPNFTKNYLKKINSKKQVKDRSFLLPVIVFATLATGWALSFNGKITLPYAIIAGLGLIAVVIRMSGWQSLSTLKNPLLLMLHISYSGFAFAFLLTIISGLTYEIYTITLTHAFSISIGASTLISIMLRASKGHNGLPLNADKFDIAVFVLILLSGVARMSADYASNLTIGFHLAKTFWTLALLIFLVRYVPIFLQKLKK